MSFAERFKKARAELGVTQEEIARRLGFALSSIKNWEAGQAVPRQQTIEKISQVTGMPVSWFKVQEGLTMDSFREDNEEASPDSRGRFTAQRPRRKSIWEVGTRVEGLLQQIKDELSMLTADGRKFVLEESGEAVGFRIEEVERGS